MTPTAPVHHLLVGQHGLALRAPVHPAAFPVSDTALEHSQKKPLVPPVILRLASGNFPAPVVAEPEPLAHALERFNIRVRPFTSDASRETRTCVYIEQLRHLLCNCAYDPCAVCPKDMAASPAHNISASWDRRLPRTRGRRSTVPATSAQSPVDRTPSRPKSAPSQSQMLNFQSLFAPALPLLRCYFLAFRFLSLYSLWLS